MQDANFNVPALAELYDRLDSDRSDLDSYAALIDDLGAHKILDVGCGTGTFACLLAGQGFNVTGVDPAAASLAVARRKPEAAGVDWVHGTVTDVAAQDFNVVVMTANVAMVFIDDAQWQETLERIAQLLKPGGTLIFEARRPEVRAWQQWTAELTCQTTQVPGVGSVSNWVEVLSYDSDRLHFRETFRFANGTELTSESTLRYRSQELIEQNLAAAGLLVSEVRQAPDRPGRQFIFVAQRPMNS